MFQIRTVRIKGIDWHEVYDDQAKDVYGRLLPVPAGRLHRRYSDAFWQKKKLNQWLAKRKENPAMNDFYHVSLLSDKGYSLSVGIGGVNKSDSLIKIASKEDAITFAKIVLKSSKYRWAKVVDYRTFRYFLVEKS